jgi:hypothetical protein
MVISGISSVSNAMEEDEDESSHSVISQLDRDDGVPFAQRLKGVEESE